MPAAYTAAGIFCHIIFLKQLAMKAFTLTLIFAIFLPISLTAAPDAVLASMEGSQEVATNNKITMITDKFGVSVPTLIAQMVNFCLVALVLYYFAVKPISTTLEERQQKISDGLQYAEEMKDQLAEAERERTEKVKQAAIDAQKILAEAREQSKEMIEIKTQEAAAQAEAIIRKASEATELERQKMLADVRQEVARLVVVTASKVLSRDLSEDEKSIFSESAAKELAS